MSNKTARGDDVDAKFTEGEWTTQHSQHGSTVTSVTKKNNHISIAWCGQSFSVSADSTVVNNPRMDAQLFAQSKRMFALLKKIYAKTRHGVYTAIELDADDAAEFQLIFKNMEVHDESDSI